MSRARSKVRAATLASVTMRRAGDGALPAPKAGDITGALALSLPADELPLDFASASTAATAVEAPGADGPGNQQAEPPEGEESSVEPLVVPTPTPVEDVAPAVPVAMSAAPAAVDSKPASRGSGFALRPPWALWWS